MLSNQRYTLQFGLQVVELTLVVSTHQSNLQCVQASCVKKRTTSLLTTCPIGKLVSRMLATWAPSTWAQSHQFSCYHVAMTSCALLWPWISSWQRLKCEPCGPGKIHLLLHISARCVCVIRVASKRKRSHPLDATCLAAPSPHQHVESKEVQSFRNIVCRMLFKIFFRFLLNAPDANVSEDVESVHTGDLEDSYTWLVASCGFSKYHVYIKI